MHEPDMFASGVRSGVWGHMRLHVPHCPSWVPNHLCPLLALMVCCHEVLLALGFYL